MFREIFLVLVITLVCVTSTQHPFTTNFGNYNKKFTCPNKVSEEDWSNPHELQRVWNAALVRMLNGKEKYISVIMKDYTKLATLKIKFPAVIYLHGCAGVWEGAYTRANFLAQSGFAVIVPVSFARKKYPQSCDPYTRTVGMYRGTLKMRHYDAWYAIAKAKKLTWVDPDNVFLMGLSQVGIAVATFASSDKSMSVIAE